jgi:hypothetical protein
MVQNHGGLIHESYVLCANLLLWCYSPYRITGTSASTCQYPWKENVDPDRPAWKPTLFFAAGPRLSDGPEHVMISYPKARDRMMVAGLPTSVMQEKWSISRRLGLSPSSPSVASVREASTIRSFFEKRQYVRERVSSGKRCEEATGLFLLHTVAFPTRVVDQSLEDNVKGVSFCELLVRWVSGGGSATQLCELFEGKSWTRGGRIRRRS